MQEKNSRECSIIAYYFSKFDKEALYSLGYRNYSTAFANIGKLFNKKPSYIKLKRDEFDAIVSSTRQGFRKRAPAKDVWEMHCELKTMSFDELAAKVLSTIEKQKQIVNGVTGDKKTFLPRISSSISDEKIENLKTGNKRSDLVKAIPYVENFYNADITNVKGNIYKADSRTISITISKPYKRKNGKIYWYGVYPSQRDALFGKENSQVVFVFSDLLGTLIILDYEKLQEYYQELERTAKDKGYVHYHIRFLHTGGKWFFLTSKAKYDISLINGFIIYESNLKKDADYEQSESRHARIKITSNDFHEIHIKKKK